MRFESHVHGSNILISENGLKAARKEIFTFANAIVFSGCPLVVNKPVALKLKCADTRWQGGLVLGITDLTPAEARGDKSLPRFLYQLYGNERYSFRMLSNWNDCRISL